MNTGTDKTPNRTNWLTRWTWLVGIIAAVCVGALADVPQGWIFYSKTPTEYMVKVDRATFHSGHASATLRSVGDLPADHYSQLEQKIDALPYRGQKVRLSGFVRSSGLSAWSGLWMRVDDRSGRPLAFENMHTHPIKGTTDWQRYEVELNVPRTADSVHFGLLLSGGGQVWLDDVTLQSTGTGPAVHVRGTAGTLNLNFEEPLHAYTCQACGGTGKCQFCYGTGKYQGHRCNACNGTGNCWYCGGAGKY